MTFTRGQPNKVTSTRCKFVVAMAVACMPMLFSGPVGAVDEPDGRQPSLILELSVRDDGTATDVWQAGTSIAIGDEAARRYAEQDLPLSEQAAAWYRVLESALADISQRAKDVADAFGLPAMDAVIVAGNRASSDAFGWVPNYIGINVQAFAETYGPPGDTAEDRMVRIVAHEYLHLLTYAHYPDHRARRTTPFDRALWTIFFEGIGDYVSVSERWLPGPAGSYSVVAADTLRRLEPIFVDRLEQLAVAGPESEPTLRHEIAMGKFDRKWGSLSFALWLHSEAALCGERETLRTVLRLERDSVFRLALRHAAPELRPAIRALAASTGRMPDDGQTAACIRAQGGER